MSIIRPGSCFLFCIKNITKDRDSVFRIVHNLAASKPGTEAIYRKDNRKKNLYAQLDFTVMLVSKRLTHTHRVINQSAGSSCSY